MFGNDQRYGLKNILFQVHFKAGDWPLKQCRFEVYSAHEIDNEFVILDVWIHLVLLKVLDANGSQDFVIHEELIVRLLSVARQDSVGCICHDVWCSRPINDWSAAKQILHSSRGNSSTRPEGIAPNAIIFKFLSHAMRQQSHAVLRQDVSSANASKPINFWIAHV